MSRRRKKLQTYIDMFNKAQSYYILGPATYLFGLCYGRAWYCDVSFENYIGGNHTWFLGRNMNSAIETLVYLIEKTNEPT